MKKIIFSLLMAALLAGCSGGNDLTVIKVASHTSPMTDIVELTNEALKEEGYEVELVTVTDNSQANVALNNQEVDANFFQHGPFMEQFNEAYDADLVVVQPVYNALVGFYSKEYTSVSDIPDGSVIAIPNDPTNEGRALAILNYEKLITLDPTVGYEGSESDITANPHNFTFLKVDLLNLNQAYEEAALVFNYPTYIGNIGLKPKTDALLLESSNTHFSISLVAREDNQDSEAIQALKRAITSEKVREFIETNLSDTATPAF